MLVRLCKIIEAPITLRIVSAAGASKKIEAGLAKKNTMAATVNPLINPMVQAVSRKLLVSPFFCIRACWKPLSVKVSSIDKTRKAIPKRPKSFGDSSLASMMVLAS